MAKFDLESAYRNIPVHPSDRFLLGHKWKGQFYVDLVLTFGLCSDPAIFNSVADALEWILKTRIQTEDLEHYLDDFFLAAFKRQDCFLYLLLAKHFCAELGVPLHPGKFEGPTTCLTVLGIELDSVNQIARLPQSKLASLKLLLNQWASKKWCTLKELQSLIGHLHHACKVLWSGRTFIRRMIDLLRCFRSPSHPIHRTKYVL